MFPDSCLHFSREIKTLSGWRTGISAHRRRRRRCRELM